MPTALPAVAAHGARAPLVDRAAAWVTTTRRLVRAGSVLALDYARSATDELAGLPWREWLRTYRRHERGGHYLADPGGQDITTDVPVDQLPAADRVSSQAEWLARQGLDELVGEGDRAWQQAASRPDVAAMTMRSRRREAEALTEAAGLGAFTVLEWRS